MSFIILLFVQDCLADELSPMTTEEISIFREVFEKTSGKNLMHCKGDLVFTLTDKNSLTIFDYYEITASSINKYCVASFRMSNEEFENKDCINDNGFNNCWLHETLEINSEYRPDFKLNTENYFDLISIQNGDAEDYLDGETYEGNSFSNMDNATLTFLYKLATIPLIDIVNKNNSLFQEFAYEVEVLTPHGRAREMTQKENGIALEKYNSSEGPKIPLAVLLSNTETVDYTKQYFYFFNTPDPDFNNYIPSIIGPSWSTRATASDFFIRYKSKNDKDMRSNYCGEFPYLGITMPNKISKKYKIIIETQWWCI